MELCIIRIVFGIFLTFINRREDIGGRPHFPTLILAFFQTQEFIIFIMNRYINWPSTRYIEHL